MLTRDYRRFRFKIVQIGSMETDHQSTEVPNWRAFVCSYDKHCL